MVADITPARADRAAPPGPDLAILDELQRRVLWLATRIIDAANHDRDTGDGVRASRPQWST
jgi:pyruvate dehydrogenase E1 component